MSRTQDSLPFTKKAIKEYLDSCITLWRHVRDNPKKTQLSRNQAILYVDAFQSIRSSIFGETLAKES